MSELGACYRHAHRRTGVRCTRCEKPICQECMIDAPVGYHCPACVGEATRERRRIRRARFTGTVVVPVLLVSFVVAYAASQQAPGLVDSFANERDAIASGEYYRLLTSTFLHVGVLHLAVNTWSLAVVGVVLEPDLGRARFVALYVLSALGASVATFLIGPASSVGASGAIFGLAGALLAVAHRRRLDTRLIGLVIVVNLVVGLAVPRIDVIGHAGGLLIGLLVGTGLEWARSTRQGVRRQAAVVAGCALAVVAGVAAGGQWGPEPHDTIEAVAEQQLAMFLRLGQSRSAALMAPPTVYPLYRAVDRTATYKVYVIQDPAGPRTVVVEFGDGTTARMTVPRGDGVEPATFRHRFPPGLQRFRQAVTVVGAGPGAVVSLVTDVCPNGTLEATPADETEEAFAGDEPDCLRPP